MRQRVTNLRGGRAALLAAPWEELTDEAPTVTGVFEGLSINSALFTGLSTLRCSSRNALGATMILGSRANSAAQHNEADVQTLINRIFLLYLIDLTETWVNYL